MGKSTISMAIFNSYFDITRGYGEMVQGMRSPLLCTPCIVVSQDISRPWSLSCQRVRPGSSDVLMLELLWILYSHSDPCAGHSSKRLAETIWYSMAFYGILMHSHSQHSQSWWMPRDVACHGRKPQTTCNGKLQQDIFQAPLAHWVKKYLAIRYRSI